MEGRFEEITHNPAQRQKQKNTKELDPKDRERRSVTHVIEVIEGEKTMDRKQWKSCLTMFQN